MRLATLNNGTKDGLLVVVSKDLTLCADATLIAPNLRQAIEHWQDVEPGLSQIALRLDSGQLSGMPFDQSNAMAPLPRAWQWLDASAFLNHGRLMQRAFNLPPNDETKPLVYQGASDLFIGSHEDILLPSTDDGIDFEGELAVIVDEVEMGIAPEEALSRIRLVVQLNDISLRTPAPMEMKGGFGFIHAKPTTSFAPVAVTPDVIGAAWKDGRVHLPLQVEWNNEWFGNPNGKEMSFGFGELISHVAKTRNLSAGTIVGSGTLSNESRSAGSACIAERRAIEMIETGAPKTPFMTFGDRVRMEMRLADGSPLFGPIDQVVQQFKSRAERRNVS